MVNPVFDFLAQRSSTPIAAMEEPAPNSQELEQILTVATRVPDHGGLTPWRFILYRGDARYAIGEYLAKRAEEREGPLAENRIAQEKARFARAPLVIGVISSPVDQDRIPEWEQFLSGGAVAMKLCLAANALGYATNWITNWYSNDESARAYLGLAPHERVIGFVHIGTSSKSAPDRPRPNLNELVTEFQSPDEHSS